MCFILHSLQFAFHSTSCFMEKSLDCERFEIWQLFFIIMDQPLMLVIGSSHRRSRIRAVIFVNANWRLRENSFQDWRQPKHAWQGCQWLQSAAKAHVRRCLSLQDHFRTLSAFERVHWQWQPWILFVGWLGRVGGHEATSILCWKIRTQNIFFSFWIISPSRWRHECDVRLMVDAVRALYAAKTPCAHHNHDVISVMKLIWCYMFSRALSMQWNALESRLCLA